MGSVDPWLQGFSSRPMLLSHQHLMRLDSSVIEDAGDADGDTFLSTTFEMPAVAPNSVLMRALPLKKAYTKMKPHLLSHVMPLPSKQQHHYQGPQQQPPQPPHQHQVQQEHLKGDNSIKTEASDENRYHDGDQQGSATRPTPAHISSTGPSDSFAAEFKEVDETKPSSTIIPNPEIANKALLVAERVTRQAIQSGAAKSRQPKCAVCRNHRQEVPLRGHKRFCPYKNCKCENCLLIAKRRDIMAKQDWKADGNTFYQIGCAIYILHTKEKNSVFKFFSLAPNKVALRRAQAQDEALGLTPCSPEPSSQGNMTPVTPGPSTPVGSKPASPMLHAVSPQDDTPQAMPSQTHNRQHSSSLPSPELREVQYNYKKKTSAARLEALKLTPELDDCRLVNADSSLGSKVSSTSTETITSPKSQTKLPSALLKQALEGNRGSESKETDRSQQEPVTQHSGASPENRQQQQQQDIWFPSVSESNSATALFNNPQYFSSPNAIEAFKSSMISLPPPFTQTMHPIFSNPFWLCLQQQQQHQTQHTSGNLQSIQAAKERLPPVPKLLTDSGLDREVPTMTRTCENNFNICDG